MDKQNSPQTSQALADAYQYNYTHIEPLAMVDALPTWEKFSVPWLILIAEEIIKIVINTIRVNRGDIGKKSLEEEVREILGPIFVQTLQKGGSFKLRLARAIIKLFPEILEKSPASKAEVTISQKIEISSQQLSHEVQFTETKEVTRKVDTTLEQPLNNVILPVNEELAISQKIEKALEHLLEETSSAGGKLEFSKEIDAIAQQISQDIPATKEEFEVLKKIDTALQHPSLDIQGIPSNNKEIVEFIISKLVKILGEDFLKTFAKNVLKELKEKAPTGRAKSLEDYRKLFADIDLPEIANTFEGDEVFAYMRLAGPNPVTIAKMMAPDRRFPVTEEQYKSVMGDADSLENAIAQGRVFLADYAVLDGALNGTFGAEPPAQKYSYAPLAMFAVSANIAGDRLLRPVAIQCGQSPTDYRIVTPSTGANAWLMAKTIVQIADANFHEAVSHLARTHLLVEPFVLATHRKLPDTHPLFKLLVPHFQGTLAINHAAHQMLIAPRGGVNKLLSSTIDNSRILAVKGFQIRGFNADMLPRRLHERGVDDESTLPVYPYRDDGLLIWQAIRDWVKAYLSLYYSSDEDVKGDRSLQNWAEELVAFDGGRLTDFGDRPDGNIQTLEYLIDAVTMVIFTASAQHAAVNFPQNGIMSFAPAMPTAGYKAAKAVGEKATRDDWFDLLPPLEQAQEQLNLLYLLGSVHFTKLGYYEDGYFTESRVAEPLQAFQKRLQEIEGIIDRRNLKRPAYNYLKPSKIPQSINI